MFVMIAHCVPLRHCSHSLLMLHNEIHPSQLGGVAVCCGAGGAWRVRGVCIHGGGGHMTNNCPNVYTKWIQINVCPCMPTHRPINQSPPHMLQERVFVLRGRGVNYLHSSIRNIFPPPHPPLRPFSFFFTLHSKKHRARLWSRT